MHESNPQRTVAAPAFADEVADGIFRVELPTPWPVGPVNTYLIDDDPLTLIDTGPVHGATIDALEQALAVRGHRVEELGRIVITHQHHDHWGLAQVLVNRSGAELCALEEFGAWLADYPASLGREERFAKELLARHGADPAVSGGVYADDIDFAVPAEVTHPLHDGDTLEYPERRLNVLHRPGHSRSDTALYDDERGVMIAGDHVMLRPSVPMLSLPLDGPPDLGRYRGLAAYKASLVRTRALGVELILPGHGEPVRNAGAVIDRWLERFEAAAARVAAAVDGRPRTVLEIATRARGEIAPKKVFFAICETLGHLEEMLDAGSVVERERAGLVRFWRA